MLALKLPPKIAARLDELAARTGRSPAELVIEALDDRLEEIADLSIAEQRWRDHLDGKSETIPLAEVVRRHDLAD
jgi:RHH-type rel operon transcriptional repressor/antitoxin RelB